MRTGLKPVLWSCAALLLLLSLVVPLINMFAILLMMVPYVVLYAILPPKWFVAHLVPVWVIAYLLGGPATLIIGLFFLIPSIVMGHLYRKKAPVSKVIRNGSIVFLALMMLEMLLFEFILDLSLIKELGSVVRTTFNDLMAQGLLPKGWNADLTEIAIRTMTNSIPVTFIMIAFFFTVVTHYVSRKIVNKSGLEIPSFALARDWKLPRILVIYYLIAYVFQMFTSITSESFFAIALLNLVPLLSYVFAIQAVGFFFFLAHQRGWNKAIPVIIAIPVLVFPPLSLIGVLDTAFPIRKSFTKS